jgi:outer membrane lipoprotein SlyB
MFKKYIIGSIMTLLIAIGVPFVAENSATAVNAQVRTHTRYYRDRHGRLVAVRRPGFYRRHRKLVNIGAGTAAGALVGGLIGGKKGAVIGGLAGAGGGALVTHKQKSKHYTRRWYVKRPRNY